MSTPTQLHDAAGPSHRRWQVGVVLIVLLGVFVRAVFLAFEVPFVSHADERTNLNVVLGMLERGSANPEFFRYPSLSFYLQYPGQFLVAAWTDGPAHLIVQSLGTAKIDHSLALIMARLTSILIGIGVLCATLRTVQNLAVERIAVVFCCFIIAFSPLLVRHSVYVTPDILAALCTTICLCFLCRSELLGTNIVLAAVFAGLAAGSKYNAGMVAIAIPVAIVVSEGLTVRTVKQTVLAGAVSFLTFALSSPFLFLDWQTASNDVLFELRHYANGHPGAEGQSFRTNVGWLWDATGWLALFLVLIPFLNWRKVLPILTFIVAYFVLISLQSVRFERNLLPILPAVFVVLVFAIDGLAKRSHAAVFGIALIGYLGPITDTAETVSQYKRDPKQAVRVWLSEIVPKDANVLLDAYSPFLVSHDGSVTNGLFVLRDQPEAITAADIVTITQKGSGRFLDDHTSPEYGRFEEIVASSCKSMRFPADPTSTWSLKVYWLKCS